MRGHAEGNRVGWGRIGLSARGVLHREDGGSVRAEGLLD